MATQQIIGEGGVGTGQYFDTATGNVVPTPTANTGNVTTPSGAIVNPTIGGLVTPPPNYATQPITSSVTTPASVPTYQTSTTPTPPAISGIDTTLQNNATTLSPAEQGISDITKRITDINNSLLGKATYTQQQNVVQGLPDLQKAQNDLVAQIKGFQNQSQALQNAYNYTIPNQMNLQAEGRGITQAGLQPITASELRKNQIQQGAIATQALTAGATLEAIKGNIANAQNLVDQAVAAKFGPLEEQNKVATENLATLLKDPNISLAEKNRADAQALLLQRQAADIAQKKQEQSDIWNISTTAGQNVANFKPTQQYTSSAQALQAIQNAPNKAMALQIATDTGMTKQPVAQSDFEQAFLREHGRLPTVAELTANKAALAAAGRAVTITPENKYLSAADATSLNSTYPNANITINDTRVTAQQKIDSLDPNKLTALITAAKNNNHSYEAVVKEINSDNTLVDKALALKTAAEVFGAQTAGQSHWYNPFSWNQ